MRALITGATGFLGSHLAHLLVAGRRGGRAGADHQIERGETLRAVRAATWIGMNLAYRGAVGPAGGWLGRAQRLLENGPDDTPEHGYLMIPLVFRHEAAG